MISMQKVKNITYHIENEVEIETNYYSKNERAVGNTHGLGATHIGLNRTISDQDYLSLMKGKNPITGEYMYQQNGKHHSPAVDVVMSAPKGFTLLVVAANDDLRTKLLLANKNAVKKALNFLEVNACYTRRGKNGVTHEKAIGFVVTMFEHLTTRELDPNVHVHCVIKNVCTRSDLSFGAIESRYLFTWGIAATEVYQAALAEEVRDLGFDTVQNGKYFDVAYIDENPKEHFSKRTAQINEDLAKTGFSGSRAADIAAKRTRKVKGKINRDELLKKWKLELEYFGVSQRSIDSIKRNRLGIHLNDSISLDDEIDSIEKLGNCLTFNKSTFSEVDVFEKAVLMIMEEGLPAAVGIELAEQFLSSELFIELEPQNKFTRLFTTKEMIKLEHRLIRHAQSLSQTHSHKFALTDQELISAQTKLNIVLSEEQFEAVLCVSGEQNFQILSGSAGAGKSKAMSVVKQALSEKNIKVYGAAIAKSAANSLQLETGIKSKTVAMTLIEMEHERSSIKKGDVLIIDEAGQLGVKQALKLFEYASSIGFKVILVGEDKQLEAIEHGGVFSYLSRPDVIGTARIETIRRQNHEWDRKAVANYRDGFAKQALEQYKAHHRLHISDQAQNAQQQLVDDWWQLKNSHKPKDTMILARTWNQVTNLNLLVRSRLQENGLIGKEDLDIAGVVNNRSINYSLSLNERIRFTENDNRLGFINGDIGTVVNIDISKSGTKTFTIRRDDGIELVVNQQNYSDSKGRLYLVPAYAQTIYSSQGRTIDGNVYVLHDNGIDRKNAYVSMSRHKEECHLYASIEEVLDIENADPHKDYSDKVIENLAKQYSTERSASLAISYPVLEQSKELKQQIEIEPEYSF